MAYVLGLIGAFLVGLLVGWVVLGRRRRRLFGAQIAALDSKVAFWTGEYHDLSERLGESEGRLRSAELEVTALSVDLDTTRADLEAQTRRRSLLEGELDAAHKDAATKAATINDLEGKVDALGRCQAELLVAEERVSELEEALGTGISRIADLEGEVAGAGGRISELESELAGVRVEADRVGQLRAELSAARAEAARIADLEARLVSATEGAAHVGELESQVIDLRDGIGSREQHIADLESRLEKSEKLASTLPPWTSAVVENSGREPDDLKEISGVGPKLEKMLNRESIFWFEQVAALDDAAVDLLQSKLPEFPNRIKRDQWVDQAASLARRQAVLG